MKPVALSSMSFITLAALVSVSCGSGDGKPKMLVGESCYSDSECESVLCVRAADWYELGRYCSMSCAAGEPCPEDMVCATTHTEGAICVYGCTFDYADHNAEDDPDYACVEGVPTLCSNVGSEEYCEECGCSVAGEYCNKHGEPPGCEPRGELGAECLMHDACISGNCSVDYEYSPGTAGQCYVAIGAACTSDDCDFCWADGTFCSRECSDHDSCPEDMVCVGSSSTGFYWCRTSCARGTCCYTSDDCGHCTADESMCRDGFVCESYSWNYTVVGYSCTLP